MPRGDGTGPMGFGPMTGRAAGYCAGFGMPGFMNPIPGRGYWGWGRGGGLGFWGRGGGRGFWGRGWGRGFRGRGWGLGAYGYGAPYAPYGPGYGAYGGYPYGPAYGPPYWW